MIAIGCRQRHSRAAGCPHWLARVEFALTVLAALVKERLKFRTREDVGGDVVVDVSAAPETASRKERCLIGRLRLPASAPLSHHPPGDLKGNYLLGEIVITIVSQIHSDRKTGRVTRPSPD